MIECTAHCTLHAARYTLHATHYTPFVNIWIDSTEPTAGLTIHYASLCFPIHADLLYCLRYFFSLGDRYNCFYAVMSKYCLKDTTPDSASFEVFRILLMYHDAELCALLDTLRVGPKDFAQTWIRSTNIILF